MDTAKGNATYSLSIGSGGANLEGFGPKIGPPGWQMATTAAPVRS